MRQVPGYAIEIDIFRMCTNYGGGKEEEEKNFAAAQLSRKNKFKKIGEKILKKNCVNFIRRSYLIFCKIFRPGFKIELLKLLEKGRGGHIQGFLNMRDA